MSSASMKVDFQVCGIPLLSLFLKAKERRNNHKFEKSRSVWSSVRYSWLLVLFIFYHYWFVKIPLEISVCSKSGWMKEDVVVMWFKHLAFSFQYCIHNPKLLITDNYFSHTPSQILISARNSASLWHLFLPTYPTNAASGCFFRVLNLFPDLI
jgi:hypothetical protein